MNAVLPLSVLIDGKVNPEGLHTTLFTIGLYALWRMERQASLPQGIPPSTALGFGALSALALLTKPTAAVLPMACAVVFLWRARGLARTDGWRSAWGGSSGPSPSPASKSWVRGGRLVVRPQPRQMGTRSRTSTIGNDSPPGLTTYRRPLGWLLPFVWR